jgi:hypothetical protein
MRAFCGLRLSASTHPISLSDRAEPFVAEDGGQILSDRCSGDAGKNRGGCQGPCEEKPRQQCHGVVASFAAVPNQAGDYTTRWRFGTVAPSVTVVLKGLKSHPVLTSSGRTELDPERHSRLAGPGSWQLRTSTVRDRHAPINRSLRREIICS